MISGDQMANAAGELKRVVMCVTLIGVHPPKLGHLRPDLLALVKEVELRFTLHVFLEREFRARKQTNRNAWLSDSSETTGDRPAELGRHQLVANLCGSGCDKIQAVVTHRWCSSPGVEADLVDQLFNSSEKRLARALLLLANFGKEGKPEPVIAKISQETLAEMIGTTRSRVSSFMNKFRKMGFIEYNGGLHVHSSLLNIVLHD